MAEIKINPEELSKSLKEKIFNASYIDRYPSGREETTSAVMYRGREAVTQAIDSWINENLISIQTEISSLEAKIYAYEAIIANSNFKAAIVKEKKDEEQLYPYMNSINANMGEFRLISAEIENKLGLLMTNLDISLNELNKDIQELKNK